MAKTKKDVNLFEISKKGKQKKKKLIPANGQTSPVKSDNLCKNKHTRYIFLLGLS